MKLKFCRALSLILAFFFSGCYGRAFHPLFDGEALSEAQRGAALNKILSYKNEAQTFRCLSHARSDINGEKATLRYAIVFERPDKLRIEALPLNSAYALSIVIANGDKFLALDTSSKRAYSGKPDAENFSKTLNLKLDSKSLIPLVIGRLPLELYTLLGDTRRVQFRLAPDTKTLRANLDNFNFYLEFDAESLLLKSFQSKDSKRGTLALRIDYDNYQEVSGIKVPATIKLSIPADRVNIDMRLSAPNLNQALGDRFFKLDIPEGFSLDSL